MKKTSITIGIPAYNEERNISKLLRSILNQRGDNFLINKIIVVSDASSDHTVRFVQALNNSKILLIKNEKRMGKSYSLNKIIEKARGDILVFFDADIEIRDKYLIEKLTLFINKEGSDITGLNSYNMTPQTMLEKALAISIDIKRDIFETHNDGNNIYTCYGRAIAVNRKLYKNLNYNVKIVSDDAYVYLFAEKNGYKYRYSKDAIIYYRLPQNLKDHKKQSFRFSGTKSQLYEKFGSGFTRNEYYLPKSLIFKSFFFYGARNPFWVALYIAITLLTKIQSLFSKPTRKKWDIALSTKL